MVKTMTAKKLQKKLDVPGGQVLLEFSDGGEGGHFFQSGKVMVLLMFCSLIGLPWDWRELGDTGERWFVWRGMEGKINAHWTNFFCPFVRYQVHDITVSENFNGGIAQ